MARRNRRSRYHSIISRFGFSRNNLVISSYQLNKKIPILNTIANIKRITPIRSHLIHQIFLLIIIGFFIPSGNATTEYFEYDDQEIQIDAGNDITITNFQNYCGVTKNYLYLIGNASGEIREFDENWITVYSNHDSGNILESITIEQLPNYENQYSYENDTWYTVDSIASTNIAANSPRILIRLHGHEVDEVGDWPVRITADYSYQLNPDANDDNFMIYCIAPGGGAIITQEGTIIQTADPDTLQVNQEYYDYPKSVVKSGTFYEISQLKTVSAYDSTKGGYIFSGQTGGVSISSDGIHSNIQMTIYHHASYSIHSFKIQFLEQVIPHFTSYPNEPVIYQDITFDATSSAGPINHYYWDFGDGCSIDGGPDTRTVQHSYEEPGEYYVQLYLVDEHGFSYFLTQPITVNPVNEGVNFTYLPDNIRPFDDVVFLADYSPEITQYDWDFGDGNVTADSGPGIVHSYSEPGEFQVVLNTYDSKGRTTTTKNLTVTIPVILVHGFNAGPETFYGLQSRLMDEGYQVINFDYSSTSSMTDPRVPAARLKTEIQAYRDSLTFNGQRYEGKYDIVCHSMGALVTRWFMEELGGGKDVRQWIGIAPVNHGAATADFASMAPDWVKVLVGSYQNSVFYLKTDSPVVRDLDNGNQFSGVKYRVIMGYNGNQNPLFFLDGGLEGLFGGKTWAMKKWNGIPTYYLTWLGDGIVANEQSKLTWAGTDSLSGYDHFMTNKPLVVNLVTSYIEDINRQSTNIIPREEDYQQQFYINNPGAFWEGNVKKASEKILLAILIAHGDPSALFRINWLGSDLDLTLISPGGERIGPDSDKVAEYVKTNNTIYYVLNNPEPGEWTAEIDPVDMPECGEPVTFATFSNSSLTLFAEPAEPPYFIGEILPIRVHTMNNDEPITGANIIAQVTLPDATSITFPLLDDGSQGDLAADDGIYSGNFRFPQAGFYTITITTNGTPTNAFERTAFLSIYADDLPGTSLHLYPGWNFISMPKILDEHSNTAEVVFWGIDTGDLPIWQYNAEDGEWVQVGISGILTPLEGYWVYSAGMVDLPLYYGTTQVTLPPEKQLYPGWNAIGPGSLSSISPDIAFSPIQNKWTTLLRFDNGLQVYMPPLVNGQNTGALIPGQGYWIYMKDAGDLLGFA